MLVLTHCAAVRLRLLRQPQAVRALPDPLLAGARQEPDGEGGRRGGAPAAGAADSGRWGGGSGEEQVKRALEPPDAFWAGSSAFSQSEGGSVLALHYSVQVFGRLLAVWGMSSVKGSEHASGAPARVRFRRSADAAALHCARIGPAVPAGRREGAQRGIWRKK